MKFKTGMMMLGVGMLGGYMCKKYDQDLMKLMNKGKKKIL